MADSLFTIQQKSSESLKEFMTRFKEAALEVYNLEDSVAALALKRGLRPSRFAYSLDKKPPVSYAELLSRAQKYVRADEADLSRRESDQKPSRKTVKPEPDGPWSKKPDPSRRLDGRPRPLVPKGGYTPLLAPISHILLEIEGEPYLRRPPPLRPGATRNKDQYCRYHRDYGHDTEDCRLLKRAIEELVQQGHLRKFVQRGSLAASGPSTPPVAPVGIDNAPTERTVAMISWGADRSPKRPRGNEGIEAIIPFGKGHEPVDNPGNDSIVVSMTIAKHPVKRILVDSGSSVDILSHEAFSRMKMPPGALRPVAAPLRGFTGDSVWAEGEITVPVTAGTELYQSTVFIKFLVVRIPLAYNAILGRPGLNLLDAIISTKRLLVRFPTNLGIGEMRGEKNPVSLCFHASLSPQEPMVPAVPESWDPRDSERRGEPAEDLVVHSLGDSAKTVRLGTLLPTGVRDRLLTFLQENADVFAWSAADMPGVPPEVITHKLNINPQYKPVRQKRRSFAPERQKAIDEEVRKLITANHIREAHYPEWLANVVIVRKTHGNWRMCVDFTDLNKACPKDSFPLPRIDQLVDATSGHEALSFMDAFSGYNQIKMEPGDEEATSFMSEKGMYCYRVMPFGLKNAGATYQRLMTKVFRGQIGRNMEIYVDDMLTKSASVGDHVANLAETFDNLRQYQIKLNPKKCAFEVTAGKFLGFMVTQRGIEANPEKIKAIIDMKPPHNKREIQRLTGRIASLSRFLAKSAERCLPFFKALRKANSFEWTAECQQAFESLKKFLSTPPLLSRPKEGEEIFLYLAASPDALSSVLVRVDDHNVQKPVYYTSKVLHDAETRYSGTEKVIFAVITSAQRLRPYFQAHPIVVVTDLPIKAILSRPDTSGRLAKWAIKLGEFDLTFRPRSAMKSQVLADFLVECTWAEEKPEEPKRNGQSAEAEGKNDWILHVDGASNSQGSGAGLILASPEGMVVEYALRFLFFATNNQAEYEALLAGMRLAKELGVKYLRVFTDSQLVNEQVKGEYEARDPILSRYLGRVRSQASAFDHFSICHVPRRENARADALSRLATSTDNALAKTYLEHLEVPSVEATESLPVHQESSWMDVYVRYLKDGLLPSDPGEAKLLRWRASKFLILDGQLYRRSFSHPLLRCVGPTEADYVLREIHEGTCGSHLGGRALSHKALRQGYYWPTMRGDAAELVRKCDRCQRHANIQRLPSSQLSSLSAPWPFAQWGMDILGPFPPASGQRKFLLVAIDHFTKWVEAEALAKITEAKVRTFFWRSIICRFGVPHALVTDNGRQFDNSSFREFCIEWGIRQKFTSVGHPQTNGATEVMNRTILQGLRTRLDGFKGRWADELPSVLWAYHTTPRVPTGETPFSLTYGTEAVIPVDVGAPNLRTQSYNEEDNGARLRANLDLIEEARDLARLKMAAYRQKVARYYNSRVQAKTFLPGDLVLRRAEVSKPSAGGKLAPNWEGPYRVTEVLHRGAYQLKALDGKPLPHTWNADNLRRYYQ